MDQISFTINNGSATNTIYMPTSDPSVNHVSLLISSTTALTLTAGTPVEESQAAGASGSLFYLHIKNLGLSKSELNDLSVTLAGWSAKVFADTQVICLTPQQDTTVAKGQVLIAAIGSFTASQAPSGGSAQLYMNFYRASPVSGGGLPFTYNNVVTLQAPPSGALDLHNAIAATLVNNTVVQSSSDYPAIENTLNLTFAPGPNPKVINAGPKTVFTVSFVYATDQYGYGAMTTIEHALDISVNAGDNAASWVITPPTAGSQNPGWMLQPLPGQPILGTNAGSTVGFVLSEIFTTFQAGATLMLVSYSGVPGYQDGAFSIPLYKEAHVYIHSLLATPNPAVLNQGLATVDLSWNASGARLTLMPGMIDVSGKQTYSAKIAESTQFTLISQGVSPSNYASSDVLVEIFPAINCIVANPQNVYYKDFPHDVLLDWSVNSNNQVALSNSVNSTVQYLPPNYTTGVSITQPQMFSIKPQSGGLPLFIERDEVISAFELQQKSVTLSSTAQALALSPTANICALIQQNSNQILILETITNTPYGAPISAGSQPVALSFSHDGSQLFVANGGDSTLTVFDVTFSGGSSGYVFTKVGSDVNLSGVPVALQVSADDTSVFVSSNSSNANPGTLDVVISTNNNYFVSNSVRFTGQVSTLAVLPSSAQIFVISQATQNVYVVGYDSIHQSYQWVRTIGGFATADKLTDIAIVGQDAGTLLIACSGSNSVYAVSKEVNSVAGKQKLSVGSNPTRVLAIESGAYAYVANSGDSSLSLISCFKGSGLCSVLESSLANGASPVALSASAQGSVIYVANNGPSLSVWSNQTFTTQGSTLSATLTTSVAASTQYVVSWHNYNIQISYPGKAATPGLSVYDRNTQTTSVVNASTQYTTFEFWPDSSQNTAIATAYGSNTLQILSTVNFSTTSTVALSSSSTCRAVATAISPFGNMIFVLTVDTGGVYQLVAIASNPKTSQYSVVSTVSLFTQPASSGHSLAALADGSSAFVTDASFQKLYIVSRTKSGTYSLESTTYDFIYMPRAMNCAPDDSQLYIWMNQASNSGFASFNIAARTLENFVLPTSVSFQISSMTIAPDGSSLYVTDTNLGVRVFSTDSMQNTQNISFPGASFPMGIAIAPDGSGLFTANAFSDNVSLAAQLAASPTSHSQRLAAMGTGAEYLGIFMRDYIGETPTSNNGSGWTMSPDIVPWGTQTMPNVADLGQQANYNTDYSNNITLGQYNNVYVRGLNTASGAQTSRIYFYWVDSSIILLPGQWSPYNFTFNSNLQNWLDVTAQKTNDIAYSPAPLSWKPSPSYPHYCLVTWVDNTANPSPPDLSQWANFASWTDLGNFILAHPNMAWRNTNDVAVATQFMNAQTRVAGVAAGGQVTVGVMMAGIPTDGQGTIQFTLINSNGTIRYSSPVHKIDTNTFSQTIQWPANAPDPILTYTYNPASGKLQGGEKITAFTAFVPPMMLKKSLLLRAPHLLIDVQNAQFEGVQEMLLGTVRFQFTGH